MPDKETLEKFGDAVEQKKAEAKEGSEREAPSASAAEGSLPSEQDSKIDHAHQQDDRDVRAKNSGHGKKTADKWNQ